VDWEWTAIIERMRKGGEFVEGGWVIDGLVGSAEHSSMLKLKVGGGGRNQWAS